MEFESDEAQRLSSLAKHGVDFAAIEAFEWASAVEVEDTRKPYGEIRWRTFGLIGERLHVLIHTRRYHRIRVITLRKANDEEMAEYEATI